MTTLRHEFYESDEKLTISVFDKGADPEQVSIKFEPKKVSYTHGDKSAVWDPLKGEINPEASDYTVGKVKVEIRLSKNVQGRWSSITGEALEAATPFPEQDQPTMTSVKPKAKKNWDGITTEILASEKEVTTDQDPNVGGDSTLNSFFQKIYGDADEDTKRAMMKSYQESGGTTLSTNWDEVGRSRVEVKPPSGSEWKKWGE